jgi:hypothetical protein
MAADQTFFRRSPRLVATRARWFGLGVLALTAAACSTSTSSPTQPSSTPTVKSLSVSVAGFVLIGTPVQATATAYRSDGTSTTTGITFSSDATAVATVSTSGLVAGVSAGSVTIRATLQGQTASQTVRVVPDFRGTWTGSISISACKVISGSAISCATGPSIIMGEMVSLTIVSETDDAVTGTVANIQLSNSANSSSDPVIFLSFPVSGVIGVDGTLSLKGTVTEFAEGLFDLQNWRTSLGQAGVLIGSFDIVLGILANSARLTFTVPALVRS